MVHYLRISHLKILKGFDTMVQSNSCNGLLHLNRTFETCVNGDDILNVLLANLKEGLT